MGFCYEQGMRGDCVSTNNAQLLNAYVLRYRSHDSFQRDDDLMNFQTRTHIKKKNDLIHFYKNTSTYFFIYIYYCTTS